MRREPLTRNTGEDPESHKPVHETTPGNRTLLQTEIDVPNPDGVLTPGTYCEVELRILRKTQALVVPAEVVIFNRDGLNVAALERHRPHSQAHRGPWSAIAARRSRSATV
jgi:hypothetical protein